MTLSIYSTTLLIELSFYAMALTFLLQRTHLLMSLLALEGMMLSLVMLIPLMYSSLNMSASTMSIILLTFGACEASLGLSLMVMMSRSYGTDLLNSLTSNKC